MLIKIYTCINYVKGIEKGNWGLDWLWWWESTQWLLDLVLVSSSVCSLPWLAPYHCPSYFGAFARLHILNFLPWLFSIHQTPFTRFPLVHPFSKNIIIHKLSNPYIRTCTSWKLIVPYLSIQKYLVLFDP